ncbi:peptide deformylase [Austwickia sp. TVS 96-490-7B]|uniref:peptide deformylase n=1 Tax=Austwickia sp. TVS 96-490-7B TaxID=2830843 RepID=UPI001C577C82|nr:peptide deformylase [Austwickia sp. TVS 96-490-7B]
MASTHGSFGSLGSFGRSMPSTTVAPPDRRPRIDGIPVDRLPDVIAEMRRGQRRRITVVGEDVLANPCLDVTEFGTPELRALIDDMYATMACAHGVGLAANQIGVNRRIFVFDCEDAYGVRHVGHVVNPVVVSSDTRTGKDSDDEGCLSVPGPVAAVTRTKTAVVHGVDMYGKPVVVEGTGTLARCLQHECDHLDGKLYIDRISGRERKRVLRDMEEQKETAWAHWDERATHLGKTDVTPIPPPYGPDC